MKKNNIHIIKITMLVIVFVNIYNIPTSALSGEISFDNIAEQREIIIVDDEGDGDYISIQEAVDNASDGDIIHVYSGRYKETVIRWKKIELIGISHELGSGDHTGQPRIDGNNYYDNCINIWDIDACMIQGFEMYHGNYGISLDNASYTILSNNTFFICREGIRLDGLNANRSHNTIIENNSFLTSGIGISSEISSRNVIRNNEIINCNEGISLYGGSDNQILNNYFSLNGEPSIYFWESGIYLFGTTNTTINKNLFENNYQGICLFSASNTSVKNNNFRKNSGKNAFAVFTFSTVWEHNYWDRPRFLPKPVPVIVNFIHILYDIPIYWFQLDWHPALIPN